MHQFKAEIEIIGINPFVFVPDAVLTEIFIKAGKDKGSIPIHGTINNQPFKQTLVKFSGFWRLYINTTMLKKSPKRIGEIIDLAIEFDTSDRTIKPHPKLLDALEKNNKAMAIFNNLPPSRRMEIVRYISFLKTETSVDRNVEKVIAFLQGRGRFVGRDKP